MMNAVTLWLRQVIAAAFFSAAVAALLPKGSVKRIAMLGCSVLLLMVLFRPFTGQENEWGQSLSGLREEILRTTENFEEENLEAWTGLIEQELVSYIETRAAEAGVSCEVNITFETNGDGVPLPIAVELTAPQRSEEVHRCVRESLGVAEENIRWRLG